MKNKTLQYTEVKFRRSLGHTFESLYSKTMKKNLIEGAREMVKSLRALVVIPEDPGSIPAPLWQLTVVCNSSSRGSRHT